MFGARARKLVLAFSLIAVASTVLPGSGAASAAPISPSSSDDVRLVPGAASDLADDERLTIYAPLQIEHLATVKSGKKTLYQFKVRTLRTEAPDVFIEQNVDYGYVSGDANGGYQVFPGKFIGDLKYGEPRYVTITCDPPADKYCTSAVLKATASNGWKAIRAVGDDGNK